MLAKGSIGQKFINKTTKGGLVKVSKLVYTRSSESAKNPDKIPDPIAAPVLNPNELKL